MATRSEDAAPAVADAFVAGDERALATVYHQWSSLVYSVALSSLGDVTDAESVTQRVFTRAWSTRTGFDPTRAKLPAWLIEITRDELLGARSDRGPGGPVRVESTAAVRTRSQVDPSDLADRLVVAEEVSGTTDVRHQVIRLALTDGLTHLQIAERLSLPADLIKTYLSGGLLELRERLAAIHHAH